MPTLAQNIKQAENQFLPGHGACAGCAFPSIVRTVMSASERPLVVSNATGCLEVVSTVYPRSAWKTQYIHSAFENASATISGVESAYKYLRKTGQLEKEYNFLTVGGDGGSYDIGIQSLSGALERGHRFVYVCYDNEAYMNTGGQKSSATPYGASTTTEPSSKIDFGKERPRKNFLRICISHGIEYAAQASVHNLPDLYRKAQKAFSQDGPAVLIVFSPCITVWKFPEGQYVKIAKLAAETRFWALYEYDHGKYTINYVPQKYTPIEEFLKFQGRFKHLFANDYGPKVISQIQRRTDLRWEKLLQRAGK
jgi:pyruvate ferredoxin oxidoreductase beta subunit